MTRWFALTGLSLVAALGFAPLQQAVGQGDGWTVLFDGKSLDNFNKIGDANWRIEDGAVVADKGNGFLVTKNSYGDFQLRAEFWADEDANSGIFASGNPVLSSWLWVPASAGTSGGADQ